jgi:hypothetical protein
MAGAMEDWMLALMALGGLASVAGVVHAVIAALMARIDGVGALIQSHVDHRFDESELRRAEAANHWRERHERHGRDIDQLRKDLAAMARDADARYITAERYYETEGRTMVRLEQIREALSRLATQETRPSA